MVAFHCRTSAEISLAFCFTCDTITMRWLQLWAVPRGEVSAKAPGQCCCVCRDLCSGALMAKDNWQYLWQASVQEVAVLYTEYLFWQ